MRIARGPLLARRTTLKLGGKAIAEVVLEDEQDLEVLPEQLRRLGGTPLVLGQGSNILAADDDLPLVLVRPAQGAQPARLSMDQPGSALIRVPSGMRLPRLLGWLQSRGLSGMEELTGIPGTLGGAVAMNAGAHGLETANLLQRVLVWSPIQGPVWREPGQWRAGYRYFDVMAAGEPVMILGAELLLRQDAQDAIRARMRRWYARKKAGQPVTMASAGCIFKNPGPDMPAGKLLDQVGLRGHRLGNMAFSQQHANFLVNLGHGRSEHALELLEMARSAVHERFGLKLETEVKVLA